MLINIYNTLLTTTYIYMFCLYTEYLCIKESLINIISKLTFILRISNLYLNMLFKKILFFVYQHQLNPLN